MTEPSATELLEAVAALTERVEHLESELAGVRADVAHPELTDDVLIAISAVVAAFLGHRAKLKQVHYHTGQAWAQQGRVAVQGHHVIHGVR